MSGGKFSYRQAQLQTIADQIEEILDRQGKPLPPNLQCFMEEGYYETFSPAVQEKFLEGIKQLRLAYVYAQRIDWFLSGDDGEERFLQRLKEEINNL